MLPSFQMFLWQDFEQFPRFFHREVQHFTAVIRACAREWHEALKLLASMAALEAGMGKDGKVWGNHALMWPEIRVNY